MVGSDGFFRAKKTSEPTMIYTLIHDLQYIALTANPSYRLAIG
jgi:hypothetical protein